MKVRLSGLRYAILQHPCPPMVTVSTVTYPTLTHAVDEASDHEDGVKIPLFFTISGLGAPPGKREALLILQGIWKFSREYRNV